MSVRNQNGAANPFKKEDSPPEGGQDFAEKRSTKG